ncbi:MAG: carboxypeptidase regulatory-like domain-containing protein, partial [Gemmatimonadetes bacterium]|nr:carboxypeptidase regulatory-like domain-containing protein [Gemmatimonadota bacterium]
MKRIVLAVVGVLSVSASADAQSTDGFFFTSDAPNNGVGADMVGPDTWDTSGIDFSLGSGSTISGTVYEADGVTPIANAFVEAEPMWEGAEFIETMTDTNGNYTLVGLSPGEYFVLAEADGFSLEIYPEVTDFTLAPP